MVNSTWSLRSALQAQFFVMNQVLWVWRIDLTIDDSDDISSDQYKNGDDEFNLEARIRGRLNLMNFLMLMVKKWMD